MSEHGRGLTEGEIGERLHMESEISIASLVREVGGGPVKDWSVTRVENGRTGLVTLKLKKSGDNRIYSFMAPMEGREDNADWQYGDGSTARIAVHKHSSGGETGAGLHILEAAFKKEMDSLIEELGLEL